MLPLAERILFATDFSECSERAFQYARGWAKACEAQLDIVHVLAVHPHLNMVSIFSQIYLDEQRKTIGPKLDAALDRAKTEGVNTAKHELAGGSANEINRLAEKIGADLIFVGTHGWTGLDYVLFGSTAERVVSRACCPVMTVRRPPPSPLETQEERGSPQGKAGQEHPGGGPVPSHLLVPMDFSDYSQEAVEYAFHVAREFDVSVTLLHVREPAPYGFDFTLIPRGDHERKTQEVEKRIKELARVFQSKGISTSFLLKDPPGPDAILEGAQECQADLIVMGTHGRRGISRVFMGSVASAILRQSSIPVLTVKSPKFDPDHPRRAKDTRVKDFSITV